MRERRAELSTAVLVCFEFCQKHLQLLLLINIYIYLVNWSFPKYFAIVTLSQKDVQPFLVYRDSVYDVVSFWC